MSIAPQGLTRNTNNAGEVVGDRGIRIVRETVATSVSDNLGRLQRLFPEGFTPALRDILVLVSGKRRVGGKDMGTVICDLLTDDPSHRDRRRNEIYNWMIALLNGENPPGQSQKRKLEIYHNFELFIRNKFDDSIKMIEDYPCLDEFKNGGRMSDYHIQSILIKVLNEVMRLSAEAFTRSTIKDTTRFVGGDKIDKTGQVVLTLPDESSLVATPIPTGYREEGWYNFLEQRERMFEENRGSHGYSHTHQSPSGVSEETGYKVEIIGTDGGVNEVYFCGDYRVYSSPRFTILYDEVGGNILRTFLLGEKTDHE